MDRHPNAARPHCSKRIGAHGNVRVGRYPWVECLFEDRYIQPFIHDIRITIIENGRAHSFILFCQNHSHLPLNHTLYKPWRGDIVVMRLGIGKQSNEVINLRNDDANRIDQLIERQV